MSSITRGGAGACSINAWGWIETRDNGTESCTNAMFKLARVQHTSCNTVFTYFTKYA